MYACSDPEVASLLPEILLLFAFAEQTEMHVRRGG
jgi:hypothetical protein